MDSKTQKEEEIYHAALKEPLNGRSSYVKAACGDDLEMLARVEALLKIRERGSNFLESPPFIDQTLMNVRPEEKPGDTIDKYRLLEQIGEGGMAVVYMAQQEQPIRRRVALKIIKEGMDTQQVIARFEAERQALALMDHPHIAKVLDAGATDTGRPYFVMELVKGVSITEYCDGQKLNTQARLNLFIQVCNALQHAHQKGIIHRDIKPSNVMVTLREGMPVPKVIDFGIAKATNQRLTEKTVFTRYAHIIGTPAYMSPEQAELSELDVDTRSDIYSLGVLLYELLTGATPFSDKALREAGYLKMQQVIREEEPTRPSSKLMTLGATLTDVALARQATPDLLRRLLQGDLDWIVMKSMEKARDRRYDTAKGFASDIKRYLGNEPVVARPHSTAYRFQKAWRRNKVVFSAAAAVAIALVMGTVVSVWQANRARESEAKVLQHAYSSDMSLAFRALEEHLYGRVQGIVSRYVPAPGESDLRNWEWRYAWAQSQSDAVLTWDTPKAVTAAISPDRRYLVSSDFYYGPTFYHHARQLWNLETREALKHVHLPGGTNHGVAFSNSGNLLSLHRGATDLHGGGNDAHEIYIYDTATWELNTVIPLTEPIRSLSFSPDDKTLATVESSKAVLWDWRTEEIIQTWPVESGGVWLNVAAFFPDGQHLAIGGSNGLQIVNPATGDVEHPEVAADYRITALAVSPDSQYVAIGSGHEDGEIGLLNVASGELEAPLIGHSRTVTSLTFSATGERLMSSSADSTIRVWDMDSRDTTRVLKGHQSGVSSASLISDETRAISAGNDKQILEWDLTAGLPAFREHQLPERVEQVVFSVDSRFFYTINDKGSVSIWDVNTFSKQPSSSGDLGENSAIILSPDGKHVIAGTGTGQLWVLDAQDLREVAHQNTQSERILPVGFSADARSLVTLAPTNTISLWNTETWEFKSSQETELKIKFLSANFNIYAIPQDSNLLLYPSGAELVWWDLEHSRELTSMRVNSKLPGSIAISPAEPLLASADRGDLIALWNWRTRLREGHLRGTKAFNGVAFSPDGRRLVTGSRGKGALMLWDVSTRPIQEITQFGASLADLTRVQFSPDGNIICGIDVGGHAYFFQAPSWEQITTLEAKQDQKEASR